MKNSYFLLLATLLSTSVIAQPAVSIHDIQYTTDLSGDSPMKNSIVKTFGIVTGVFTLGPSNTFFIQDGEGAWTGLYVNDNSFSVSLGDSIEVSGLIEEYFGLTQMTNVQSLIVKSSGNILPNATILNLENASDESYESVYVKIMHATCTVADAGLGQFIIQDSSSTCIVDDEIFSYMPQQQNMYNISGIRFFQLGENKILPREVADIELTAAVGIEENILANIYPNPTNSILTVQIPSDVNYELYNVQGQLIYSGKATSTIDVSDFSKGVYQLKLTRGDLVAVEKILIY